MSASEGERNSGPSARALGPHKARLSLLILVADVFHFGLFHVDLRITNPPKIEIDESEG